LWYYINMAEESYKVVVTDTLKVEVFFMPVIDISTRFAWRIVEPVPMIWQTDGRLSHQLSTISKDRDEMLKDFFLRKWKTLVYETKVNERVWPKECEFLEQVDKVNLIICDLVPRSN